MLSFSTFYDNDFVTHTIVIDVVPYASGPVPSPNNNANDSNNSLHSTDNDTSQYHIMILNIH